MVRILLLSAALLALAGPAASAAAAEGDARAAYAERRALLEADARCSLFAPPMRAALEAGAGQARGALFRAGWTSARVRELESAAIGAARARPCGDARTEAAAARARAGFASWSRIHAMDFPGAARTWSARRTPDPVDGWRLKQALPGGAAIGVREADGAQRFTLIAPLAANAPAPASARLMLRDPIRARATPFDVPGRLARGLEAGAPAPQSAQTFLASARRIEGAGAARRVVFAFPDAAFAAFLALDPREAAVLALDGAPRLLVEVGDAAAARAFLAAGE